MARRPQRRRPAGRAVRSARPRAAWLVEFLLPADPRFAQAQRALRHELAARFGGVTSHVRTPARGLWQEGGGDIEADDVVAHEVLVPRLDPRWWSAFRRRLEVDFEQDVVVLRASRVRML